MQCPECKSSHIRKNGINKKGKQNHICVPCGRQFIDNYENHRGYDEKTKKECLTLGFRGIEHSKGVHHTTVIHWVKSVGKLLPEAYDPETIPEVGELDELETFVAQKKQNLALDSR